jgi:hypothetical protein
MSINLPGLSLSLIHSATRRLRTEVITDFGDFLALKPEWDALLASAAEHSLVTHEWIRAWWESFGATRGVHIILVREGNRIVGIAPMMSDVECFYGFKMRKLSFVWNKHVTSCDFIVSGRRPDIYRALWNHIVAQSRRWDLVLLPLLPDGSPTLTCFRDLAYASGFVAAIWSSETSAEIPVVGTWMFIYPNNPRTAVFHAMKFRLAPMIEELGQGIGVATSTAA